MGREEWYRNTEWDEGIESAYRAKLSRARGMRPQYLQIQAAQLAKKYPGVALGLIDEYFQTQDDFVVPSAYCARAEAYMSLGLINEAVTAYQSALEWENGHPNFITNARINLPILIVENRLEAEYDNALCVLTDRFKASDHSWPSMRYYWNGCCALITYERGQKSEAREFAERALRAAAETESPFRYHRSMGLVTNAADDFGQRLKRIARPSILRSLFRLAPTR
jgi:tetratricopeptide (TPR) repeat protein